MTNPASPYDEEYYQKYCGPIPYDRSQPVWLQQFGRVADAIQRELRPGRVLDVGCAKGFLVECLWDRGIQAYGTDISEVAIAAVRPDIRPFCKVARATDPITERFDLVTCIEVLEHLGAEEARQALRQITSCTDTVLFSSTPSDLEESTHQNVRPLLSWVHEFAEFGFLPDLLLDASFAAPHAMLFRRASSYDARQVDQLYVRLALRTMQVVDLTARLGAEAAARAGELARLRGELEHTRRDHIAVLGSRFWRLTYPFRIAMTAAKKALRSNGHVPSPAADLDRPPEEAPGLDRRAKMVSLLDPARMVGLEIGPLANPIVTPSDGKIYYLDHASTDELKAKYKDDASVDTTKIGPVDFVWRGAPLRETIPAELSFDYVIASHVIEHVPDVIGWLRQVSAILKPDGLLSLAIPDRRYTFDFLRQTTTLAELVEAYLLGYTRPSPRQIFDFCSNCLTVDTGQAWIPGFQPTLSGRAHTDEGAMALAVEGIKGERYIDVHCTVYTADTFLDLLRRLFLHDLIDFKLARFFPPKPGTNEFHVTLRKLPVIEDPKERIRRQIASLPRPH